MSFRSTINLWKQAGEVNKIVKSLYLKMRNDPKKQTESMFAL